jgi:site-specific DNA-methyltransferase (adenine-specific)
MVGDKIFDNSGIELYHDDCMSLMAKYPDNHFELAIVDPPYGIDMGKGGSGPGWVQLTKKNWDETAPTKEYFDELFRVSKNQIIWGANYFTPYLPPSMGWVSWHKAQQNFTLADFELAYTSFDVAARQFEYGRGKHAIIFNSTERMQKFHPTMKPVELYKWLLDKFAKPDDKILDTHLGSGSIVLACYDLGYPLVASELDEEYCDKMIERVTSYINKTPAPTEKNQFFEL